MFPIGNIMRPRSTKELGGFVKALRRAQGLTQADLALTAGTNRRFIIELENGKPTCQIGKALRVLQTLGGQVEILPPRGVKVGPVPN